MVFLITFVLFGIEYDPVALMEENIMHSMSQQHFLPGTADSKVRSQTLRRNIPPLDEDLDCNRQYLLVPPLEVEYECNMEPSKVHSRLEDAT